MKENVTFRESATYDKMSLDVIFEGANPRICNTVG
jgi:hypothetical protein